MLVQEVTLDYILYLKNSSFYKFGYQRMEFDPNMIDVNFPIIVSRLQFLSGDPDLARRAKLMFDHSYCKILFGSLHLNSKYQAAWNMGWAR